MFGAGGKSSIFIVEYLSELVKEKNWKLTLCDRNLDALSAKIGNPSYIDYKTTDIIDNNKRSDLISSADFVISMLPAFLHNLVAKDCLNHSKNMVTASYVSEEMKALDEQVKEKGLLFMNEIGVDPGLDHMSAKRVIDEIHELGGKFSRFETFTGGLIDPKSDNNPLNYKFTWNPRFVVIAGSSGSVKFLQEGQYKYIPYHRLFRRTELIEIENYGMFEGYANRDSLKYIKSYNLEGIKTMYRGTFRRPGFSRFWDVFVQLGATDDHYTLENSDQLTFRSFINSFLVYHPNDSVELKLMHYLKLDYDSDIMSKLKWLGVFEETKVPLKNATPAQILQYILEQKLKLEEGDNDMIVMWHKFIYELNGKQYDRESSLVCIGEGSTHTAMAKTVGLPLAIYTKHFLEGRIKKTGVHIPITADVYEPVLKELEDHGIVFKEKVVEH